MDADRVKRLLSASTPALPGTRAGVQRQGKCAAGRLAPAGSRPERGASVCFFLWVILTACAGKENLTLTAYIPPTPVSAPLATSQAAVSNPLAAPTLHCVDNLHYLQDMTIPDGSRVTPGSTLDKQWQVENNGSCNWDDRYRLRLIAGPEMGAPAEQALYPARSGTQAVIRILFTAPLEAGEYLSEWQAYAPDGTPFGETFFIKIIVE